MKTKTKRFQTTENAAAWEAPYFIVVSRQNLLDQLLILTTKLLSVKLSYLSPLINVMQPITEYFLENQLCVGTFSYQKQAENITLFKDESRLHPCAEREQSPIYTNTRLQPHRKSLHLKVKTLKI